MSNLKRYYLDDYGVLIEHPNGEYVLHSDYARLKAEVERLISVSEAWKKRRLDKVEDECIKWSDYEKLKAENERLRKAGDEMVNRIRWFERPFKSVAKCPEIEAWNAAKEGKGQP